MFYKLGVEISVYSSLKMSKQDLVQIVLIRCGNFHRNKVEIGLLSMFPDIEYEEFLVSKLVKIGSTLPLAPICNN